MFCSPFSSIFMLRYPMLIPRVAMLSPTTQRRNRRGCEFACHPISHTPSPVQADFQDQTQTTFCQVSQWVAWFVRCCEKGFFLFAKKKLNLHTFLGCGQVWSIALANPIAESFFVNSLLFVERKFVDQCWQNMNGWKAFIGSWLK